MQCDDGEFAPPTKRCKFAEGMLKSWALGHTSAVALRDHMRDLVDDGCDFLLWIDSAIQAGQKHRRATTIAIKAFVSWSANAVLLIPSQISTVVL